MICRKEEEQIFSRSRFAYMTFVQCMAYETPAIGEADHFSFITTAKSLGLLAGNHKSITGQVPSEDGLMYYTSYQLRYKLPCSVLIYLLQTLTPE